MIPGETVTSQKDLGMTPDPHVSPLRVMRSAAGYYVGTTHITCGECDDCKQEGLPKGFEQPNSRETDYMAEERAVEVLREMLAGDAPDEIRTPAFNQAAVHQLQAVELPPGITGEELYKLIHDEED